MRDCGEVAVPYRLPRGWVGRADGDDVVESAVPQKRAVQGAYRVRGTYEQALILLPERRDELEHLVRDTLRRRERAWLAHAAELIPGPSPHHAPAELAQYPGAARVDRLQPLVEDHPPARGVSGVLQRQGADLTLVRKQALDPVHPGRYQPPLQLAEHRAADPPVPPRRRQADPHHPRPVTGDGRDRDPHQLIADDRSDRGLMRPDGGDQIG